MRLNPYFRQEKFYINDLSFHLKMLKKRTNETQNSQKKGYNIDQRVNQ